MKCSHCGDDVNIYYTRREEHLCNLCLMELSHTFYKPIKCTKCGEIITAPLMLTHENDHFCSEKCLAEMIGFNLECEKNKEDSDSEQ